MGSCFRQETIAGCMVSNRAVYIRDGSDRNKQNEIIGLGSWE